MCTLTLSASWIPWPTTVVVSPWPVPSHIFQLHANIWIYSNDPQVHSLSAYFSVCLSLSRFPEGDLVGEKWTDCWLLCDQRISSFFFFFWRWVRGSPTSCLMMSLIASFVVLRISEMPRMVLQHLISNVSILRCNSTVTFTSIIYITSGQLFLGVTDNALLSVRSDLHMLVIQAFGQSKF